MRDYDFKKRDGLPVMSRMGTDSHNMILRKASQPPFYKRARMSLTLRLICAYLGGFNKRFRHAFMVDYMGIEI